MSRILSIIIPVYNEEKCISALWERLRLLEQRMEEYSIEFISWLMTAPLTAH